MQVTRTGKDSQGIIIVQLRKLFPMKRYFTCLLFPLVFMACNNDSGIDPNADSPAISKDSSADKADIASKIPGCYLRVMQRDTLAAFLTQDGNIISGKLTFDNYQKDGSSGTVTGIIDEDILKLVYRFQSEGMNSISEVYFKITAAGLIHGTGEIKVKGDSAYYSAPGNVVYNDMEVLTKVDCNTLPAKYK